MIHGHGCLRGAQYQLTGCLSAAMVMLLSLCAYGQPAATREESARTFQELIRNGGPDLGKAAADAFAERKLNAGDLSMLLPEICRRNLDADFANRVDGHLDVMLVPTPDGKFVCRDEALARELLEALLRLDECGGRFSGFLISGRKLAMAVKPETLTVLTRLQCGVGGIESRLLFSAEAVGRSWGGRDAYKPVASAALKSLREILPRCKGKAEAQQAVRLLKIFAVDSYPWPFPLDLRLEALGLLWSHYPVEAALVNEKATALAKDPEIRPDLEQIFVYGETIEARCQALLMIGARGEGALVRDSLSKDLQAEDLPAEKRERIVFALRLLNAGNPAAPPE
jgi:hypothetical protein